MPLDFSAWIAVLTADPDTFNFPAISVAPRPETLSLYIRFYSLDNIRKNLFFLNMRC